LAILYQMIQRQRYNLIRRQPGAVGVHHTESISIAITAEAELRFAAAKSLANGSEVVRIGLGKVAAEKGIEFVVENNAFPARLGQQRIQVATACAVQQIEDDGSRAFAERGESDKC